MSAPFWIAPLLGALAGGATGFVTGLLGDRLRRKLSDIDAELDRLDEWRDAALDVIAVAHIEPSPISDLRKLSTVRRRLGTNINRLGFEAAQQVIINANLTMIDKLMGKLEDGVEAKAIPADLSADIERECENLRRRLKAAAQRFVVWKLLRN